MYYPTMKEIDLLHLLVKHAEDESVDWYFNGVVEKFPLSKQEYDAIMRQLEYYGAIEPYGETMNDPVYAVDFKILPGATQILRELEHQSIIQSKEIRKGWFARIEKIVWLILGVIIGIVGQFIARKIGLIS